MLQSVKIQCGVSASLPFASNAFFYRYVLSVLRLRLFCTLLYVQVMRVIAINVCVQYNGGLLPDIILLFDPMLFPSGNPFKEGLGAFWFFCKQSCNPGFACILSLCDTRAWQLMILYIVYPYIFRGLVII